MEEEVLEKGIEDLQQLVAREIREVAERKDGLWVRISTRRIGDIQVKIQIERTEK